MLKIKLATPHQLTQWPEILTLILTWKNFKQLPTLVLKRFHKTIFQLKWPFPKMAIPKIISKKFLRKTPLRNDSLHNYFAKVSTAVAFCKSLDIFSHFWQLCAHYTMQGNCSILVSSVTATWASLFNADRFKLQAKGFIFHVVIISSKLFKLQLENNCFVFSKKPFGLVFFLVDSLWYIPIQSFVENFPKRMFFFFFYSQGM